MIQPLSHYITVELEEIPAPSATILTPPQDNPMRWARITAIGPLVRDLQAGQRVMVSTHQGTVFGSALLLPAKSVLLTDQAST